MTDKEPNNTFIPIWLEGDIRPTHYTVREGGEWEKWEGCKLKKERLDLNNYPVSLIGKQVVVPYNDLYAQHVHSLAFADPALGYGNFPRWDCVNGWTDKFQESITDGK